MCVYIHIYAYMYMMHIYTYKYTYTHKAWTKWSSNADEYFQMIEEVFKYSISVLVIAWFLFNERMAYLLFLKKESLFSKLKKIKYYQMHYIIIGTSMEWGDCSELNSRGALSLW